MPLLTFTMGAVPKRSKRLFDFMLKGGISAKNDNLDPEIEEA